MARVSAICLSCSNEFKYSPYQNNGKFCSNRCSGDAKLNESRRKFMSGIVMDRPIQKRLVTERDGWKCQECGIANWQGKPIALQLDHTDGCPANNDPSNLRLLCPNCHTQTPSFGAKNKGKGRKALGLPTR